jgi:hypothetical protein
MVHATAEGGRRPADLSMVQPCPGEGAGAHNQEFSFPLQNDRGPQPRIFIPTAG